LFFPCKTLADPLNQELESDFDAPGIIHIDLNAVQHENRRNLLIFVVELDGNPVNALVVFKAALYPKD
jgi:hypothetical protein